MDITSGLHNFGREMLLVLVAVTLSIAGCGKSDAEPRTGPRRL